MPMSSLELVAACQQKGFLSKEAAARVLEQRELLIKEAMRKAAAGFFGALRSRPASKAGKVGKGFLERLKVGGRTPIPEHMGETSWTDVTANLAKMMALAGMTAGATAGIGGLMRHSRQLQDNKSIATSYTKMFDEYPKLKEIEDERPGLVQRNFGVLARYAPSLAAEPSVAGAWVQSTALMGHIDANSIKNLAETQRRIDEVHEGRKPFKFAPLRATEFAAKAMMG